MQGIEFLLWKHPVCDDYHKAVSVAGMILNHLQPVVLGAATWAIYRTRGAEIAGIVPPSIKLRPLPLGGGILIHDGNPS